MIPLSVLGALRHQLIEQLAAAAAEPPVRATLETSVLDALRQRIPSPAGESGTTGGQHPHNACDCEQSPALPCIDPTLHVLCRSLEQIEATLACGVSSIQIDLRDLNRLDDAVQMVHDAHGTAILATPRIHKPLEPNVFDRMAKCRPDGVLVRNLAGLAFFRQFGVPVTTDFSLNVVNDLAFDWFLENGANRITAAYDLNEERLLDLATRIPTDRLEVVLHRHTPMFHTEYCLFCGLLSEGKNRSVCGRPCLRHAIRLRDRRGAEHRVLVDSQCRNTVFHAEAQTLGNLALPLRQRGVRHFRVELLDEKNGDEIRQVVEPFQREMCL
jgi:putative protease